MERLRGLRPRAPSTRGRHRVSAAREGSLRGAPGPRGKNGRPARTTRWPHHGREPREPAARGLTGREAPCAFKVSACVYVYNLIPPQRKTRRPRPHPQRILITGLMLREPTFFKKYISMQNVVVSIVFVN